MLYRGPQSTHEVAQYPEYRLAGSSMSERQRPQVATSGGIRPVLAPSADGRMAKPAGTGPARGATSTESIRESGRSAPERRDQFVEPLARGPDLDLGPEVLDRARKTEPDGLGVDEGPEADALHDAPDSDQALLHIPETFIDESRQYILEFSVTGHIRIINDPVELVPLLITFNDEKYKQIYELLNHAWMTEAELAAAIGGDHVDDCITILKKGNLVEEQWRMPEPGKNPEKEFRATYSKFRANFQCGMSELADLLYISISNDESLRTTVEAVEAELASGNISINDLARKYSVSPFFIRGIAKRSQRMDVRGQGLVFLDRAR